MLRSVMYKPHQAHLDWRSSHSPRRRFNLESLRRNKIVWILPILIFLVWLVYGTHGSGSRSKNDLMSQFVEQTPQSMDDRQLNMDSSRSGSTEDETTYVQASEELDTVSSGDRVPSPPHKLEEAALRSEAAPESHGRKVKTVATSYEFPSPRRYTELDEMADHLPDLIHIPFQDAVREETLDGWEDDWFTHAEFDAQKWGSLPEPKIDFVYTWVNGSEQAFSDTMRPFELNSSLNDPEGEWIASHGVNRYRDWDELRYSIRSIEQHAGSFRNKIQLLVNAVSDPEGGMTRQRPTWLNGDSKDIVQILSQEDFFGETEKDCLPTFNSLTIENQIYNTKSDTDRLFALSDDMLLAKTHAASDLYSPLFGPTLGFKSNAYNTQSPPTDVDAARFGEKPYLIYTSWMLNRRFGKRKRRGQVHFGKSLSRSLTREAISSFPRPQLKSACQKFRGETGFQLYSWYATIHYTMERHREALLWSYIMVRSDLDGNGNLGWEERKLIMAELSEGLDKEGKSDARKRMYYHVAQSLEEAGLDAPKVNVDTLWTSLDGPLMIKDTECFEFDVNHCLAPGFSSPVSDTHYSNPIFSTAAVMDRVSREDPKCGDCLIKLLLNRSKKGLSPLLPSKSDEMRKVVLKALKRYNYIVIEPDALFMMVTDSEQVENTLISRYVKGKRHVGQLCLNDDVSTDDVEQLEALRITIKGFFESLWSKPSPWEK